MADESSTGQITSLPLPSSALEWLRVFGPGAVVASLTIGTGELIFSTRGGSLFGFQILFVFVLISVLKWGLVLASARHMVLTGVHPYQRMLELPGPRGWLPLALLFLCAVCLPVWIAFHAGVIGNLTSWITGTRWMLHGAVDYLWGTVALLLLGLLTISGGYSVLERVQLLIVGAMMVFAGITLVLYNPDWLQLLGGLVPRPLHYPAWLPDRYPGIAEHSVWIETTRYVGVIGGAGFDYLAYTSWLREKRWGILPAQATADQLSAIAQDSGHPVRRWVRAPIVDATVSFALIIGFSAVFVASGALILHPHQIVPDEGNLLNLQARFVTEIHSWLLPLYVSGAFLAMLGTLYGTMEIAVSIADEILRSFCMEWGAERAQRVKRIVVAWCLLNGLLIQGWLFIRQSAVPVPQSASAAVEQTDETADASSPEMVRAEKPALLLALITPANLLTGVLSCGLICCLNLWMDRRFLPGALRMPVWLAVLNLIAGVLLIGLGLKGFWDAHNPDGMFFQHRLFSLGGLLLAGVLGATAALAISRQNRMSR